MDGSTSVSTVHGDGASDPATECISWLSSWMGWSKSVADAAEQIRRRWHKSPRFAVLTAPFTIAEGQGVPQLYPVPRHVLRKTGMRVPPRSPWLSRDLGPMLAELVGCPVLVMNEAHLCALGEARFGAGRRRRAVVHVSVAGSIGTGLVFDGYLFTGSRGFAGALAHVQVTPAGHPCFCGSRGCLVTEAAALQDVGADDLVSAAPTGFRGDRLAELGALVGRALAPLLTTLDPDCVVTDARLGKATGQFIAGLSEQVAQSCPPQLAAGLVVIPGELDDAARFGALAVADSHAANVISPSVRWALPHGA
jgi:predicted NBD/HSP70 family sugar kinase